MSNLKFGKKSLPVAISDSSLPLEDEDPPLIDGSGPFKKLLRTLRFNRITSVTIEAGHIYADQIPGSEQREGFLVASRICERLFSEGIVLRRIVFVDDYNVQKNGFSLESYLQFAAEHGFAPEHVFWESKMAEHAAVLIEKLAGNGHVASGEDQELLTVKQSVKLRHSDGRFTCAVLDAAFHLERFRQFGYNITVLPSRSERFPEHDYHKQQRNLRRLLRLLGNEHSPLATVFFDSRHNLNVVH